MGREAEPIGIVATLHDYESGYDVWICGKRGMKVVRYMYQRGSHMGLICNTPSPANV
jgi:hypothetical protein